MKSLFATLLGTTLVFTGAATTFIAPAHANPSKPVKSEKPTYTATCSTSDVSLLIPVETDATACSGPMAGNDTGGSTFLDDLNAGKYFSNILGSGLEWTLLGKSDVSGDTVTDINGEITEGNFSFLTSSPIDKFIVTLKANDFFSAYLFNNFQAAQSFVGDFDTIGVSVNRNNGDAQSLSHLSVFVAKGNVVVDPEPVPEPASLLGIGLMAGGLVAARRRKAQ